MKENRTYDQLFGDMSEGNGDPTLAQFGEKVTPNQHALAKQFGLYDNVYDIGTNSAEGHNWLMQGDNPEYTESSAGEYHRSYDTEEDVLGHQRSGFLWTAVEAAGATARNYGEFEYIEGKPSGTWQQYYCATKSVESGGDPAQLTAAGLKGNYGSVIPSLNAIADPLSPPFDLSIPDIYRAQIWKQDFEKNGPANLNMIWLSSDHTGGPADSEAGVADNDLAVGQIVDTISHSKYWKDSAIFVVEDDSQDGADHVDGHRAPVQVISPWAQHGKVDQHLLLADLDGPHDRADPRRPAAEREGRRGHADVRRVHHQARLRALQRGAEPDPADRGHRHRARLWPGHPGPHRRRGDVAERGGGRRRPRCLRASRPPRPPGRPGSPASTPPATARSPTTPTRSR